MEKIANYNSDDESENSARKRETTTYKHQDDRSKSKSPPDDDSGEDRNVKRKSDLKPSSSSSHHKRSSESKYSSSKTDKRSRYESDSRKDEKRRDRDNRHDRDSYHRKDRRDRSRDRERDKDYYSRDRNQQSSRRRDEDRRRNRSRSKDRKRRDTSRDRRSRSRDNQSKQTSYKDEKSDRVPGPSTLNASNSVDDGYKSRNSSTNNPNMGRRIPSFEPNFSNQQPSHPMETGVKQQTTAGSSAAPPIELPSYYNAGAINVQKYANQIQKRKLLWGNKKTENVDQAAAKWQQTAKFSQDQDGKMASKFMRLMGIKQNSTPTEATSNNSEKSNGDIAKKQQELFSNMEQQYEVARVATHTMRGVGLGFSYKNM